MNVKIEESWRQQLAEEFDKPYFASLVGFVRQEYQQTTCYPPGQLIFNAFNLCPFDKEQLLKLAEPLLKTEYGKYLVDVANGL